MLYIWLMDLNKSLLIIPHWMRKSQLCYNFVIPSYYPVIKWFKAGIHIIVLPAKSFLCFVHCMLTNFCCLVRENQITKDAFEHISLVCWLWTLYGWSTDSTSNSATSSIACLLILPLRKHICSAENKLSLP